MPKYEYTTVYVLDSVEKVEKFCKTLRQMKDEAPISLILSVAITATREVQYVGLPRNPAQRLLELDSILEPTPSARERHIRHTARPGERRDR